MTDPQLEIELFELSAVNLGIDPQYFAKNPLKHMGQQGFYIDTYVDHMFAIWMSSAKDGHKKGYYFISTLIGTLIGLLISWFLLGAFKC